MKNENNIYKRNRRIHITFVTFEYYFPGSAREKSLKGDAQTRRERHTVVVDTKISVLPFIRYCDFGTKHIDDCDTVRMHSGRHRFD